MATPSTSAPSLSARLGRIALAGLALFLLTSAVAVQAFSIPSPSMSPTLLPGDYVFASKLTFGGRIPFTRTRLPALSEPAPGDVAVFEAPHVDGIRFVKRIVGTPGDTLAMRDGQLYRNGRQVDEPYVHARVPSPPRPVQMFAWQRPHLLAHVDPRWYVPTADTWGPIRVPSGAFFVLGDNRVESEDSRYWGFVPRENIEARVRRIYFSYEPDAGPMGMITNIRWGRLGSPVR